MTQVDALAQGVLAGGGLTMLTDLPESGLAGTVQTTVAIDGRALLAFNDLNDNSGGQARAFADTGYQGQWPWHGVFTANEGGTLTRRAQALRPAGSRGAP